MLASIRLWFKGIGENMLPYPLDWLTFDAVGSGGFLSWLGADTPDAEALKVPIGMAERVVLSVGFLLLSSIIPSMHLPRVGRLGSHSPLLTRVRLYLDLCLCVCIDLLHLGCSGFSLPEPMDSATFDRCVYDDERYFLHHFFGLSS